MVVEGGPNDGSVAGSAQPGRGSSHERPGPGERELALAHIGGSAVAPGFRVVGGINGGHRAVPARNGEPTGEAGAGRSCRGAHLLSVKQDYGCLWAKCSSWQSVVIIIRARHVLSSSQERPACGQCSFSDRRSDRRGTGISFTHT